MIPKFNTIIELLQRFPDEKSCHQYLASRRWNGYMECPRNNCKGEDAYVFTDGIRYKCKCCKTIYTAKTGTIFEESKLSLTKWFVAIYLVMHKKGISSVQLGKDVGCTQKTAWFLLQRIRTVLGNLPQSSKLEGTVQLDETFVGGKNKNRHHDKKVKQCQGRSFKDKVPVMGMLQQQEYELVERPHMIIPGKTVTDKIINKQSIVRCNVVRDTKASSLHPILKEHIKEGSIIVSDEWFGYRGLAQFDHQVVDHGVKQYVNEGGYTSNALEGFWSHVKRSIIGIYHKTSKKHLPKYMNEFVFRYNYRDIPIQTQMNIIFDNANCRLTYQQLIQK